MTKKIKIEEGKKGLFKKKLTQYSHIKGGAKKRRETFWAVAVPCQPENIGSSVSSFAAVRAEVGRT